jgi:hypothetical protein
MPHMEIVDIQREIAEFYNNRKDILKEAICYIASGKMKDYRR